MDWHVTQVRALPDYCIHVTTAGGMEGVFDMKPYLDRGIFSQLKSESYFQQVGISYGAVTWPGGQDIAPQTLLAQLQRTVDVSSTPI